MLTESHRSGRQGRRSWFPLVIGFLGFVLVVIWWRWRQSATLPARQPWKRASPPQFLEPISRSAVPDSTARPLYSARPTPRSAVPFPEQQNQVEEQESRATYVAAIGGDDLTLIKGIGAAVAALLTQAGIASFRQLAEADVERLRDILRSAGLPMLNPNSWPTQARLALNGQFDALEKRRGNPIERRRGDASG